MPTVPRKPRRGQRPATSVSHVSARLNAATIARLDALAPIVAPLGVKPSRSMAILACILTGLDVLEEKNRRRSAAWLGLRRGESANNPSIRITGC